MLWLLEANEFTDKHIGDTADVADGVMDGDEKEDDDAEDGDACKLFIPKGECDGDESEFGITEPFMPVYKRIVILF